MELITSNENLKKSEESYFCKICIENIFPFQHLSDEQYITLEKGIDRVLDGALKYSTR